MKTSIKGINLIKSFEGVRLVAYKCVPTELYYTIGYGHYGKDVDKNATITRKQADTYLKKDLAKFEKGVNKYNSIYKWNQNEFDAMVSFAYNIGSIYALTSDGVRSKETIATKMLLYNKSGDRVLRGLVERRKKERDLFVKKIGKSGIKLTTLSYVVRKGDTLSGIARMYNTTVNKLVDYNDIKDPDKIFVGQLIKIC